MLVREIYSAASRVQIWLGDKENDSALGMEAMAEISNNGLTSRTNSSLLTFESFQAISAIFRRPWWSRIWVIQELALAKRGPSIICGYRHLPWKSFIEAADLLEQLKTGHDIKAAEIIELLSNQCSVLWQMRTLYHQYGALSLRDLFQMSKDARATDPRDQVYGLLGLAREVDRRGIVVDYSRSIAQVYRETTAQLICLTTI